MTIKGTFDYQNELPSLPIPSLYSTKTRLLEWIEPLVSEEQFKKTTEVIYRFFAKDGEAEKLQSKLHKWDQDRSGSWLKPFWDNLYLEHRDSLPFSMNFNILLKNDHYKNRYTIPEMAGNVSFFVAELYHSIIDGEIEPEKVFGNRLDMSQYKNFFRSVRIPKVERDEFQVADFDKKNNHVVILHKNNVYKLQVTNNEGAIYNSADLAATIEELIQNDDQEGVNVGLFTAAERDKAAKVYNMLSVDNDEILQTISDSLVVISIDEESENTEEALRNMMLNADNKYFDKTIQIIITKHNQLGFNIEHCAVDGTSLSAVISHVSKGLKQNPPQPVQMLEKPTIEKQTWKLEKGILDILNECKKDHLQRKDNYYLKSNIFTDFGAEEIKKMNFSPNAFFHMALQIAQYRTYGKLRSVYEPVSVRFYNEGRTECARATSMEKRELVKALETGNVSEEKLHSYMQKASIAHSKRIRDCQKGLGVERHMYGLEQMYHLFGPELGMKELPQIFLDKSYLSMRNDFISTSGMAYENVKYRMFGPVAQDGHGLAYILLEDSITLNVSSFTENKSNGKQLINHLVDALRELKTIATNKEV